MSPATSAATAPAFNASRVKEAIVGRGADVDVDPECEAERGGRCALHGVHIHIDVSGGRLDSLSARILRNCTIRHTNGIERAGPSKIGRRRSGRTVIGGLRRADADAPTAGRPRAGPPPGTADVLASVGGDELDADRQAGAVPVQRQVDRRLPAGVERRRERHERCGTEHRCHRRGSRRWRTSRSAVGGSASVGVSSRSQPSAHHCCTARRNSTVAASASA